MTKIGTALILFTTEQVSGSCGAQVKIGSCRGLPKFFLSLKSIVTYF